MLDGKEQAWVDLGQPSQPGEPSTLSALCLMLAVIEEPSSSLWGCAL